MKIYSIQYNVGAVKYVVSYHNGISKNKDNSDFFDIATFKKKKTLNIFIKQLKNQGYVTTR